jgi:hypothetical protein
VQLTLRTARDELQISELTILNIYHHMALHITYKQVPPLTLSVQCWTPNPLRCTAPCKRLKICKHRHISRSVLVQLLHTLVNKTATAWVGMWLP